MTQLEQINRDAKAIEQLMTERPYLSLAEAKTLYFSLKALTQKKSAVK